MTPKTVSVPALAALVLALAGSATAGSAQLYAEGVPLCKPQRHRGACDSMLRVLVSPGTHGARRLIASPAGTTVPCGGLTPVDITSAYGLSGTGSGQTVAIVDAYNDPKIN